MKSPKYLQIVILFLFSIPAIAQDSLEVKEVIQPFSKGNHTGYTVIIPQAKLKDVSSGWKKYLRERTKANYSALDKEFILTKSIVPDISSDSIIIYTKFFETPKNTQLNVFVSHGTSMFYNSNDNPETASKIKSFIRNFAVAQYRSAVQDEMDTEQKKLSQLERELKALEQETEKAEKTIKSNKRENERLENEIKSNLREQEGKTNEIDRQRLLLTTHIRNAEQRKEEEKKLKDLEQAMKKLKKKNESLHKNIEKNENENKTLQRMIDKNNSETIPSKRNNIVLQKEVGGAIKYKLQQIK